MNPLVLLALVAAQVSLGISASRPLDFEGEGSIAIDDRHMQHVDTASEGHASRSHDGGQHLDIHSEHSEIEEDGVMLSKHTDDPDDKDSKDDKDDHADSSTESEEESPIGHLWKKGKTLGKGAFGSIWEASSISNKDDMPNLVTVKMELANAKKKDLDKESGILLQVQGHGIPKFHQYMENFGVPGDGHRYLIMQKLGIDLEHWRDKQCDGKLSESIVLRLARQMIQRFEHIHDKKVIYRDTKPNNFMLGWDQEKQTYTNQVFLIDFGLSTTYWDNLWKCHLPQTGPHGKLAGFAGTQRYASTNAFKRYQQSRKDDMETLGYVWSHLYTGALPWAGMRPRAGVKGLSVLQARLEMFKHQMELRSNAEDNEWTYTPKGTQDTADMLPPALKKYMTSVKDLKFDEEPDYKGYISDIDDDLKTKGIDKDASFLKDDGTLDC